MKKPHLCPTPTSNDAKSNCNATANRNNPDSKHHSGTTLTDYVRLTSTCSQESGASPSQPSGRDTEPSPSAKTKDTASESSERTSGASPPTGKLWPTPDTGESPRGHGRRGGQPDNGHQHSLDKAVKLWPTPNAMDSMSPRSREALETAKSKGGCSNLKDVTAHPDLYSSQTSTTSTAETSSESICSQGDFLASLSPLPASVEARRMTVISGRRCSALLRRHDPTSSLLRMFLGSSRWASTVVFLTWKERATPLLHRLFFQLVPWGPSTAETESSLLPTISANEDAAGRPWTEERPINMQKMLGNDPRVRMWRTPNTMDGMDPKSQAALDHEAKDIRPGRSEPNNLRDQMAVREGQRNWPTPQARDWKDGQASSNVNVPMNSHLGRAVLWPSPTGSDDGNGAGVHGTGGMDLRTKVSMYPTPQEDDSANVYPNKNRRETLAKTVNEETGNTPTTALGSLNPNWVEWLQGFPIGWTDCAD